MNDKKNLLGYLRWIGTFLPLFLSACSIHHQPISSGSIKKNLSSLHAQYAAIANGKIEYYRFGDGSPVVLIAGYATDISSWDQEFLTALSAQHNLIVFNNRNVGGSVIHSTQYESKDLADDTAQLIQVLGLKKPAVIGISMGGMIAQQLAVLHPNQLGQLILINTAIAGKQAIHPSPEVEKKMLERPKNKFERYVSAIQLFFPPSWRVQMAYDLAVDRFQPENYTDVDTTAIMPAQRQLVLHWIADNSTAYKIKKLMLPVLILNGEADIVIPPTNSLILTRNIPHATLMRWKEGGHAMIYQYPQQIASVTHQFILNHS
jgi:pimeloyl-ACP methyl ester carboxylesterase